MPISTILRKLTAFYFDFYSDQKGGTTIQFALIAMAVAIFAALALPPLVERNIDQLAFKGSNIDRTITGSIKHKRRYTIRKSVLDPKQY